MGHRYKHRHEGPKEISHYSYGPIHPFWRRVFNSCLLFCSTLIGGFNRENNVWFFGCLDPYILILCRHHRIISTPIFCTFELYLLYYNAKKYNFIYQKKRVEHHIHIILRVRCQTSRRFFCGGSGMISGQYNAEQL